MPVAQSRPTHKTHVLLPNRSNTPTGKVAICNLQKTPKDKDADVVVHTYVDDLMRGLMSELGLAFPIYRARCRFILYARRSGEVKGNKGGNLALSSPALVVESAEAKESVPGPTAERAETKPSTTAPAFSIIDSDSMDTSDNEAEAEAAAQVGESPGLPSFAVEEEDDSAGPSQTGPSVQVSIFTDFRLRAFRVC